MSEADTTADIVNRAKVAMEKISPSDGDLVVITFSQDVQMEQIEMFAHHMEDIIPDGVSVFCTKDNVTMEHLPKDNVTMEHLPKEQMNALGWYNINENTSSDLIN